MGKGENYLCETRAASALFPKIMKTNSSIFVLLTVCELRVFVDIYYIYNIYTRYILNWYDTFLKIHE